MTNMNDGKFNIYSNQDYEDPNIFIKPATGFNLNIECNEITANNIIGGISTDGPLNSFQYNDNGELNGSTSVLYDPNDTSLIISKEKGQVSSDILGQNGLSILDNRDDTSSKINLGYDVAVSSVGTNLGSTTLVASTPSSINNYLNQGFVQLDKFGANFNYVNEWDLSTFCDDLLEYIDIAEDNSFMCISYSAEPKVFIIKNSGGAEFNPGQSETRSISGFLIPKITSNYIAMSNASNDLSVWTYGSSWTFQQKITTSNVQLFDIQGSVLMYYFNGQVFKYTKSGTVWSLLSSFNVQSSPIKFEFLNDTVILGYTNELKIYQAGVLVYTFAKTGLTDLCINSSFIFYSSLSSISILKKTGSVWAKFGGDFPIDGTASMACNEVNLITGRPTINTGLVTTYTLNTNYIPSQVDNNLIVLNDGTTTNMSLSSAYGDVSITSNFGNLSLSGSSVVLRSSGDEKARVDNDGITTSKLASSEALTLESKTNKIDFLINGSSKMALEPTTLTVPNLISSVGAFQYSFFRGNVTKPYVANIYTAASFNTTITNEIVGLSKVDNYVYPASSSGGTRFTNSTSSPMCLIVSYSCGILESFRTDSTLIVQESPEIFYNRQISVTTVNTTNLWFACGCTMIILGPNKSFLVAIAPTVQTSSVNNDTIQIYRLR